MNNEVEIPLFLLPYFLFFCDTDTMAGSNFFVETNMDVYLQRGIFCIRPWKLETKSIQQIDSYFQNLYLSDTTQN